MPDRSAQASDGDAVFNHVRDHVNLRMAFHEAASGLLHGRPIEFSEAAAECDEIVQGEILAAETNNQMIQPGAVDFNKILVAQVIQRDVLNFSSESRAARDDRHEQSIALFTPLSPAIPIPTYQTRRSAELDAPACAPAMRSVRDDAHRAR